MMMIIRLILTTDIKIFAKQSGITLSVWGGNSKICGILDIYQKQVV